MVLEDLWTYKINLPPSTAVHVRKTPSTNHMIFFRVNSSEIRLFPSETQPLAAHVRKRQQTCRMRWIFPQKHHMIGCMAFFILGCFGAGGKKCIIELSTMQSAFQKMESISHFREKTSFRVQSLWNYTHGFGLYRRWSYPPSLWSYCHLDILFPFSSNLSLQKINERDWMHDSLRSRSNTKLLNSYLRCKA